jgi:hypothetical protein
MFSGGDYDEVARWLRNFVTSHAKREDVRVETLVEAGGPREARSYGIRVARGERLAPPETEPPLDLAFSEVRDKRGGLAWCGALADRVRALARQLSQEDTASRRSA